ENLLQIGRAVPPTKAVGSARGACASWSACVVGTTLPTLAASLASCPLPSRSSDAGCSTISACAAACRSACARGCASWADAFQAHRNSHGHHLRQLAEHRIGANLNSDRLLGCQVRA